MMNQDVPSPCSTVVVLLSDKRSGSTFLERELCSHSQIQHVSYTPHTYNETHYWTKAAHILGAPPQINSACRPLKSYGSQRAARRSLVTGIKGNIPHFVVPKSNRELVFNGWEALCERFAQPVFFEKTPHHLHNWSAIELILQWSQHTRRRARFIGLVRNPMAVMYSAQRLFHTDPETRQFAWLEASRNLLLLKEFLSVGDFKLLKYEDIVSSPECRFKEICSFVGVKYEQEIGREAHERSKDIWSADPNFNLQLHDSVARVAHLLGYAEHELYNQARDRAHSLQGIGSQLERIYSRARSRLYYRFRRFRG